MPPTASDIPSKSEMPFRKVSSAKLLSGVASDGTSVRNLWSVYNR